MQIKQATLKQDFCEPKAPVYHPEHDSTISNATSKASYCVETDTCKGLHSDKLLNCSVVLALIVHTPCDLKNLA
jgi:hypothetical protein